jgi:xylulokinase
MVIDAAGVERGAASVATPFVASTEGIEMSVGHLLRAVGAAMSALGAAREGIAAVGLTGMAESGAPMLGGRPVGPVIAWHDGRGEETAAALERCFGPELTRRTGRRIRSVSSVAKLGWLVDRGGAVPDRWFGVPELVLWRMTGAEATEHSLAARTGAYDVIEGRFLPEVVRHLMPSSDAEAGPLFPPVRTAGRAMGAVSEEVAGAYGLPAGIPVTIAGHDHLAAAAGLGGGQGDLFNSVGTAETLLRRLDSAPDMDRALELDLAVTVWPGGDAWCALASAARSGIVLGELAASLGRTPAELDGMVGSGTDAGRAWEDALTELAGRTIAAGNRLAELAGPHKRLLVYGGGSRSLPWVAAKARAAGVPVLRCTVAEAAARGAALAAGSAVGWWPAGDGPAPALEPIDLRRRQ